MSSAKKPPVCPQMSPRSSQMQNVEPSRIVSANAYWSRRMRPAARLGERLDDDLVHVHVQRPRQREEDAVGDVLRRQRLDALVHGRRLLLVALEADERELGPPVSPGAIAVIRIGRPSRSSRSAWLNIADGRLDRAVDGRVLVRGAAGDRVHVDDVPAVADVRQAEARHPHQPVDVRLDHPLLVVLARLPERVAADRAAGVVDEDVEPAERLDRRGDEPLRAAGSVTSSSCAKSPSRRSTRRAPTATLTPASRSAPAVAAPIPLEAPVTIAVLPSRLIAGTATESIAEAGDGGGTSGRSAPGPRACSTWSVECSSPNSSRQAVLEPLADRVAVGARGNENVRGDDRKTVRQRPDVQVVHLDDLGLRAQARCPTASGWMFVGATSRKMRVDSRSNPNAPQNMSPATRRPAIGSKRSHPVTRMSAARDRCADERRQVGRDVQERAADVQALAARTREQRRRDEVDGDPRERDDEDDPALHVARAKPVGESRRIRSRCRRAGATGRSPARRGSPAAKAVRPAPLRGPRRHRRGGDGERERGDVGDQVPGVGEQGERAGEDPGHELDHHQRRDQAQALRAGAGDRPRGGACALPTRLTSAREGASTLPR